MDGFLNVDVEKFPEVDIVADFRELDIEFRSLDEIQSHHLLEHFGREEAMNVLALWFNWLKLGGLLIVETPDFDGICERFRENKYWLARHAYGSQEADWAFHRDGWWEEKFREIYKKIGLEILDVKKSYSRVVRYENGQKVKHLLPNITVIAKRIW